MSMSFELTSKPFWPSLITSEIPSTFVETMGTLRAIDSINTFGIPSWDEVSIKISHGMLTEYSQDVKACALGQAAASIVGNSIIGCTSNQVRDARDQLLAMLTNNGPPPEKPFQDLEILSPAKDYKNRHSSIMLTLEALVEALETTPG